MKKVLYFGHPVNVYGTPLEQALLERITRQFSDWQVENPNQPKHDDGYKRYGDRTGRPMDYFVIEVLPAMNGGVFLPFRDGKFGAGVYKEAEVLAARGCPLWLINAELEIRELTLDPTLALGVDETRARVRGPNRMFLPF